MNNSLALELQPQLIEGDGDLVKGKTFIAQVVDVQSPAGGNPTQQKSKGDDSSIPISGESESGTKILTTTQYKIYICSLHSEELEDEDLPWATPYWMNSNLGSTAIPSPRFEPGSFVFCWQDLKSRQWFIDAACPNQLEKLEGSPSERCKAFSGFAKRNGIVPESSSQGQRTGNSEASSTTSSSPTRVADAAETQNTVPSTADDKQNTPREPGEELEIPQACKDAARKAGFGLNNSITKLIKDIEKFKANNPLLEANEVLDNLSGQVNAAASTVTNYLANLVQEMKAFILRKVSAAINQTAAAIAPPNKRFLINDGTDAALDQISCLFDKILRALLSQISKLLNSLISKLVNTAQCVVEGLISNFLGQLMGQIMGIINGILGQISGVVGSLVSITNEVLDFVVSILQLLSCEPEPQCAGVENYNFLEGPDTTDVLDLGGIFDKAKGIMDTFSNFSVNINPDQFEFDFDVDNAIKNTLDGCFAGPENCGPPRLSLYGGSGSGGLFNPVLDDAGQLFGFDIVNPGKWTSKPKGKVVDGCGNGTGGIIGDIIIGDIPQDDLEGDAPRELTRINIVKQPEDINTKKNKTVTFKVRAKIEPTDGKKQYRWYYSPDLGNNFLYIQDSDDNKLEVKATKDKDNYFYVCKILDARKGLKKRERAKSVKSDVVRLNLTDVTSAGDDDYESLEPVVTLKINKRQITKNNTERAKVSWTVKGKDIRDVRLVEIRKYKDGKVKNAIYQKPSKKKAAKSGYIYVCPPVETEYKIIATNAYGTGQAKKTLLVKFIPNKCQFDVQQSLSKPNISNNGTDSAIMFWNVTEKDKDKDRYTVNGVNNPRLKDSVRLQPNTDTTYYIDIENNKGKQYSSINLTVGNPYLFPVRPTPNTPFFTNESPSACASLDTFYITRDGRDSAQLTCEADGNGYRINSMQIRDLKKGRNLFNESFPGPSNPEKLTRIFTVKPDGDTNYQLTVETNIGISTSIIKLDTKKMRNCGEIVVSDEPPDEEPGKNSDNCPPGFVRIGGKCVRKRIRDPWLPPPLFPTGIIQIPIQDPGRGYDPTLDGSSGGSGRTWKGKCEVAIERVNGDWEVVGIGSEYTLYLGDTVYQPEKNPVTLGVPNGNERHNENIITWEKLDEEEIKKQIPGAEVFGTPYRVKDMSGFDDSRGSEIFKEVSMLDIKPIGIKGQRLEKGIYFDMTEFDDFQDPNVTFIASNRSKDKNFHAVRIPQIGKFEEDAGRVIKKDVQGGKIYGPIENDSRIPKFGFLEVDVEVDVDAPGWNGPGIYYSLLDEEPEAIDVDFTVVDANFGSNNSITIPKNTFKDQKNNRNQRTVTKKYSGGAIFGPCTSSGPGDLYIGGKKGPASDFQNNTIMLASTLIGAAIFIRPNGNPNSTADPVIQINEPAVVNFNFFTDDNSGVAGVAIKKIRIRDPFNNNRVLAEFDYTGEITEDSALNVTFVNVGVYPIDFIRPGMNQPIQIRENGKKLRFRDNKGDDENARLVIENQKKVDVDFMRIDTSIGKFVNYEEAPQVKGTLTIKKKGIVELGKEAKARMYLETETPQGKKYAVGTEGEFDEDDLPKNNQRDVVRYYENADSSRTLVVSSGKKSDNIKLDMVLRADKGVFKRYGRSVRIWRFNKEYKEAKDLGFSDQDIRWHLEHVFKSGKGKDYDKDNIIDEAMEKRLRDSNFGPLPQNFDNIKDMTNFDPQAVGGKSRETETPVFGYIRDYPYARDLGFSDADIRYYLTEVFLQKYPTGRIGPRMKAKLMDPTFGVFSYNPTFKINVGRPNLFDCENDYPYALSQGFGDIDIRYFLQYVYPGLVDECMKKKLEDPNWGRMPDFRVEVTSKGCPDPCEGVVCPDGQICKDGECIPEDDPCADVNCPDGFRCVNGECVPIPPSYPIIVTLCGIEIDNPGFGYDCSRDQIVVDPPQGVEIKYTCNTGGRLEKVEVIKPGIGFTRIPTVTINTTTGNNAVLRPVFCFVEPETKDPCEGVDCPPGFVCRNGKCVPNPCEGVVCPEGFKCVNGICVPVTVDPCEGVECPPGQICINGECVGDPCAGVICPEGYTCVNGDCVPNPCYGVVCPPGTRCENGVCVPVVPTIPPGTPVVRVVDCVGKIDPTIPDGNGNPGRDENGNSGRDGKQPYSKPKREVCN